jgi:hypothetical protein
MVFFTRELYEGIQPESGWEHRAMRQWDRLDKIYARYAEVVGPLLPSPVRRLCREGLHDGIVREAAASGGELTLVVDTTGAPGRFRGRGVRLTFRGVRGRPAVSRLPGGWWLYEEGHLTPRARFSLQVLFDRSELEVEADDLIIERLPRSAAKQTWPRSVTLLRSIGDGPGERKCCSRKSMSTARPITREKSAATSRS